MLIKIVMKKAKRIFCTVVILILILAVVAIAIVALNLDTIVKKGVETVGPQITKVSIKLDAVHLSLLNSSIKMKGLVVGNPEGYRAPDAINASTIAIGVNPFSLSSEKIVVRSIKVEAPEITFEGGLGGNNLSKIMDNVNGPTKQTGLVITNSVESPKSGKKIEVDDLLITGAKVHAIVTDMGGKEITLILPDIHLTDLGKSNDGLTPTDLTRAVLKAIISTTVKAVTSEATSLSGKGAELLKDNDSVNKIKKGIGGLLGK
jgi:uncharacterized protein involved in outer membrane biogenesis